MCVCIYIYIYNVKCSFMFKRVYLFIPSVVFVLVYHRYTNANIGPWRVGTQFIILLLVRFSH